MLTCHCQLQVNVLLQNRTLMLMFILFIQLSDCTKVVQALQT